MPCHIWANRAKPPLAAVFQMRSSGRGSALVSAWRIAALALAGAVLVQCSSLPPPQAATSPPSVAGTSPSAATAPPATTTIRHVSAADLGPSWHPGCPVEPRHLRRVDVNYIGFDGQTHRGDVIVHEDLASEVVVIFEQLRQLRYPIEKIRTADTYPGADDGCPWKTTTPRRSIAETFPVQAAGRSTHSVEPSISTHCSTPPSIGRAPSNPRTPRHTSTATAQTPESCTRAMLPCASSPIAVGAGVVTGELPDYQHFER